MLKSWKRNRLNGIALGWVFLTKNNPYQNLNRWVRRSAGKRTWCKSSCWQFQRVLESKYIDQSVGVDQELEDTQFMFFLKKLVNLFCMGTRAHWIFVRNQSSIFTQSQLYERGPQRAHFFGAPGSTRDDDFRVRGGGPDWTSDCRWPVAHGKTAHLATFFIKPDESINIPTYDYYHTTTCNSNRWLQY